MFIPIPCRVLINAFLSHRMLAGISCLSSSHLPTSIPKSHVPQSMSIPVCTSSSQSTYPTHILAIGASKPSGNEHLFTFPVHSLVIAAQCSRVPQLPPSSGSSSGVLHLPILPLALPSPAAFKVLHGYLYNHSLEGVLKSLFPLPAAFLQGLSHHTVQTTLASSSSLHQLSSYLCSSASKR